MKKWKSLCSFNFFLAQWTKKNGTPVKNKISGHPIVDETNSLQTNTQLNVRCTSLQYYHLHLFPIQMKVEIVNLMCLIRFCNVNTILVIKNSNYLMVLQDEKLIHTHRYILWMQYVLVKHPRSSTHLKLHNQPIILNMKVFKLSRCLN